MCFHFFSKKRTIFQLYSTRFLETNVDILKI
jgi:hypothetical protein